MASLRTAGLILLIPAMFSSCGDKKMDKIQAQRLQELGLAKRKIELMLADDVRELAAAEKEKTLYHINLDSLKAKWRGMGTEEREAARRNKGMAEKIEAREDSINAVMGKEKSELDSVDKEIHRTQAHGRSKPVNGGLKPAASKQQLPHTSSHSVK
ncbi:MAG: hypothetical protein NTX79_02230 [Candidatus Micrarchaeota archaeon]|nr:hypothetical protein [Candidatus Micrarchaeota archaeon]